MINLKNIGFSENIEEEYLYEDGYLLINSLLPSPRVLEIINRLIYDIT